MKRYFSLLVSFISFLAISISQNPAGDLETPIAAIEFTGLIVDGGTASPLGFAAVSVFNKQDSSLVGGALTDENGRFNFSGKGNQLFAKIEFLGYETLIIDPVPVENKVFKISKYVLDLGTLKLYAGGILIEEVEIQAERSETQFSLDKRVFNVGKDLANRGGTAEDILDNVPSVTVDVDGQVSLRGSSGVRILIDGKPSNFASGDDAGTLRQIPADLIEKVEVITNPSARYEAEGMAGIINIVLKKEKRIGFNGAFNGTISQPLAGGVGASLNYRKNKLNWFATYNLNYRSSIGGGTLYQEVYTNDTLITDQTRNSFRTGLSNSIRFGVDYFFTEKESFTNSFRYSTTSEYNTGDLSYVDYETSFDPENLIGTTFRGDEKYEADSGIQYRSNYRKEFSNRDHFLNISAQYENDLEEGNADYTSHFQAPQGPKIDQNNQRSSNDELRSDWLFQADYNHPFSKDHKYELGVRASWRDISNEYEVSEETADDAWDVLEEFSDHFDYNEDIYAAYAQYGNKFGPISFQLGVRSEYAHVRTALITLDYNNTREKLDFFPSAFLNYEISEGNALQTSYSRRIRRPRFWDLNPFWSFTDNRNIFAGNPKIASEYTDSYEINYLRIWEEATLSTGLYYRYTTDPISRIREVDTLGTNYLRPQNLVSRKDMGLESTLSYSALKWLRLDGSVNVFRAIEDGTNIGAGLQSDSYTMSGRLTSRITAIYGTDFQIRGNYRAPRQTAQGRNKAMGSIDLGISRDFLKSKNLSLTLSVRDILNSRRRNYIQEGDYFFTEGSYFWRGRSIRLSASYRINQQKRRGDRSGGGMDGGGDGEGF